MNPINYSNVNFIHPFSSEQPIGALDHNDESLGKVYSSALTNLSAIIENYTNYNHNDKLSKRLHDWCHNWLFIPVPGVSLDDNVDYTEEQIEVLMNNTMDMFIEAVEKQFSAVNVILRNDFNLENPIVNEPLYDEQGDHLMDASEYHKQRQLSPLSPYDNRPLNFVAHPFAKAIREWTKELSNLVFCPFKEPEPLLPTIHNTALMTICSHPSMPMSMPSLTQMMQMHNFSCSPDLINAIKLSENQNLALMAINKSSLENVIEIVKSVADQCGSEVLSLKQHLAEEHARAQEEANQHQQVIENKINNLKNDYQHKNQILQNNITVIQQKMEVVQTDNTQTKAMVASLEKNLQDKLDEQVVAEKKHQEQQNILQQTLDAEINDLNQKMAAEKLKSDQERSTIEELNAKIQAVVSEKEAQKTSSINQQQQFADSIKVLQQQINAEKIHLQEEHNLIEVLQNQLNAAVAQHKAQVVEFEKRHLELRQNLEAQLNQKINENAAECQRLVQNHNAAMSNQQKLYNHDLDQRLAAQSLQNQQQLNHMQNQLNHTQNQFNICSQQNQTFSSELTNLNHKQIQLVTENQANKIQAAKNAIELEKVRKSKKKKKFLGVF